MSLGPHISLINLGLQLQFEIDEEYKKQICFAETLVVSCGHTEGVFEDDGGPESEFTCSETTESVVSEVVHKDPPPVEIKDYVSEPEPEEEDEDINFQMFFFPTDCKVRSNDSVTSVDGWPAMVTSSKKLNKCTCAVDPKDKNKCECFTKLPCKCGAKRNKNCTCAKLENICICEENLPKPVCGCNDAKICTCFAGLPRVDCKCDEVAKPCICKYSGKLPKPVCDCKTCVCSPYTKYPKTICDCALRILEESPVEGETKSKSKNAGQGEPVPCICQKPDPVPPCLCEKGKDCTCNPEPCDCGVQNKCLCEPTDSKEDVYKIPDSESICSCPEKECDCNAKEIDCECFPQPNVCTCGDPANCKCKMICECGVPCVCDLSPKKEEAECVCADKIKKMDDFECQCICKDKDQKTKKKLKKVRAGKEGYRWCNDVDPLHTYFDYSYGRHDKIDYREQEKEKFKILGLYSDKEDKNAVQELQCPVHPKAIFKRKVRKPSIDCCSAVGGISINVESLGEEKDKFLIQVVSHSSKEGAKTGSKLISIVDCNLHTMEENRIEHITKNGLTKEQRSYMAICENGYYNKITRICGERDVVQRLYHTFDVAHDFLLEGSNVVLLRYLALRRHKGRVKTMTVLIDGTVCESNHVCVGVSQAVVNGKTLFVYKVERHIIEPSGYVYLTRTMLSLKGYIISNEWSDSSYVFHINPLLQVVPEKDEIEQHAPLRENWRQDLQLLSDYLDFKSLRTAEGGRYIEENGELTSTIRDYLQAVLLLKPEDVVHFTRHYFQSAISAMDLPHDEYFDKCPKHVRYFYFEQ